VISLLEGNWTANLADDQARMHRGLWRHW
jgi:hypothetical protein